MSIFVMQTLKSLKIDLIALLTCLQSSVESIIIELMIVLSQIHHFHDHYSFHFTSFLLINFHLIALLLHIQNITFLSSCVCFIHQLLNSHNFHIFIIIISQNEYHRRLIEECSKNRKWSHSLTERSQSEVTANSYSHHHFWIQFVRSIWFNIDSV